MSRKSKFECKHCGDCCRVPAFYKVCGEYEKAISIFTEFNLEYIEVSDNNIGLHLIPKISQEQLYQETLDKNAKVECPFLSNEPNKPLKCLIYDRRPALCKAYKCNNVR